MTWLYQGTLIEEISYYVYAYLRNDGSPFYIGKGKNNRYRSSDHSVKVPSFERIIFLETNLTELGAFALERRMIKWYGRKDLGTGILRNKTDGGEGVSSNTLLGNKNGSGNKGKPKTEEHRLKISKANKGKLRSADSNKKQALAMTGRKQSLELILKRTGATIGNKWWSKDNISRKSRECPGEGWILGRTAIRKDII